MEAIFKKKKKDVCYFIAIITTFINRTMFNI